MNVWSSMVLMAHVPLTVNLDRLVSVSLPLRSYTSGRLSTFSLAAMTLKPWYSFCVLWLPLEMNDLPGMGSGTLSLSFHARLRNSVISAFDSGSKLQMKLALYL